MRLLSLTIEQFRSYADVQMDFQQAYHAHLFVGPNGVGKTNILEAISVLSLTRSFFGLEEDDVTRWGTGFYRVSGRALCDAGEEKKLEVVSQREPRRQKACFLNDVRVKTEELIGQLPTVSFLPQDLHLFSGPPAERRRFLDQILCQVLSEYFQALTTYQRILKQRNALLKSFKGDSSRAQELETWDHSLATEAGVIVSSRLELLETFNLTLLSEVRAFGEHHWDDVRMLYVREGKERNAESITAECLENLRRNRDRDILLQSTTTGPHRDDWQLLTNERDIGIIGSRGQQRVCTLALVTLEASYLELRRNEKPIILLDDVYSELDDAHREAVLRGFGGGQILMTGTHIPPETEEGLSIWEVPRDLYKMAA